MLTVALVAVCTAALTTGTWFWTRILFSLALVLNLIAVLGWLFGRERRRAFWAGFALFGWSYWLIVNHPMLQIAEHQLIVNQVVKSLKAFTPEANDGIVMLHKTHSIAIFSFERSVYSSIGLLFSYMGGFLAGLFTLRQKETIKQQMSRDNNTLHTEPRAARLLETMMFAAAR